MKRTTDEGLSIQKTSDTIILINSEQDDTGKIMLQKAEI